jgi:hypothetical protein
MHKILMENLRAISGKDALDRIKTIFLEGDIEASGLSGTIKISTLFPEHYKEESNLIYPEKKICNNKTAWIYESGIIRKQGIWETPYFITSSALFLFSYLVKPGLKFTYQGEDDNFYIIKMKPNSGTEAKLFFDKHSYLLLKTERLDEQSIETLITTYSDFHTVEGIKLPFRIKETNSETAIIQVKSVKFNSSVKPEDFAIPTLTGKSYNFINRKHSTKIPFKFINNWVIIKVKIDSSEPLNFILDSGAGANAIDESVARELGLVGKGKLTICGSDGETKTTMLQINSIGLKDIYLSNQFFIITPLKEMLKRDTGLDIAGILGYRIFGSFVVEINYSNRYVKFYNPEKFVYKGKGEKIPITIDVNTPFIEVSIDGKYKSYFTLDTGFHGCLALNSHFVSKNRLTENAEKKIETSSGFIGGKARKYITRGDFLEIGKYRVDDPIMSMDLAGKGASASSNNAGRIGGGVFKQFTLILDYQENLAIFEPNENFGKRIRYDGSGLELVCQDDKFIIERVIKDSPAQKTGIKNGDEILKINGKLTKRYTIEDIRRLFRDKEGTEIILQLKRRKKINSFRFQLKELI